VSETVRLEEHASIPLAVVRRQAETKELSQVVPEACGIVWNALRAQSIAGAGRHVAVYLDCAGHLEVGVELRVPYAGDGRLLASATPAGRVATTTHLGPYQDLAAAHYAIQKWLRETGHKFAGPCWELYGHWQEDWNEHPERIRTDVCYLLK
jgi:hypothetical protein